MIHLSLADLANIRRRQKIHAAELQEAGLLEEEEDEEEDEKEEKI